MFFHSVVFNGGWVILCLLRPISRHEYLAYMSISIVSKDYVGATANNSIGDKVNVVLL